MSSSGGEEMSYGQNQMKINFAFAFGFTKLQFYIFK